MCDLFQANPWKPLLCTNCHQNRAGHSKIGSCEHQTTDLPSSTSSMHLYEEIMAQYFTTQIESLPIENNELEIIENQIDVEEDDEDSFSDEEQQLCKPTSIEFIQNQSMINTQGIVLIGPDLRTKQIETKKPKKMNLLKKSKSNADECLKKREIFENNSSKLWWFKAKKNNNNNNISPVAQIESKISSPSLNQPRIRVLPEMNKLTLNEALNITRRQQSLPSREPKLLPPISKSIRSSAVCNYGSSITSTVSSSSSSTQSSTEYESNPTINESTYLTAVSPVEKLPSSMPILDRINKLTIERLTADLRLAIDEYKQNLPVARFQTLKSFFNQDHLKKILSPEAIYFLLLQILDQSNGMITSEQFLIAYHSMIPIIVTTHTSNMANEEESSEEFVKNLARKFFDTSICPIFNDLSTLETMAYRCLCNEILPDIDQNNISMQRVQILELFWKEIPSVRDIQINEENERNLFTLYYLMRYISQLE